MLLRDEFQVTLPINVTGLATNTPGAYETTLAYSLELPGTREVALIDITYSHNWLDLEKKCLINISTVYNRNDEANVDIVGEANSMRLVIELKDVESYHETTNKIQQYRNPAGRRKYRNQQITINFKVKNPLVLFQKSINLNKY